jgi:His-Xaa-Ser system radical SAM maturase HxsB
VARRFRPPADFHVSGDAYGLLPFRFHALSDEKEVLVNEVGDFLICPRGTAGRIARREVSSAESLYGDLTAGFFITEETVPGYLEVLATRYRTKKSFLDSFTALHIIVVTLRCNHSCHYCQVSRQTPDKVRYDITLTDLDRSLDLIFMSPSREITIEFQGGEPTVVFDKIVYAVEGALDRNALSRKSVTFVVCTNLTMMTDEMLEFCRRHNIVISTSLDGPARIHDQNRPIPIGSSYAHFQEGLKRARNVLGSDRISALLTVSRAGIEEPERIVDSYIENGFDRIFFRPIHPYGFAKRLSPRLGYDTDKFIEFYKRGIEYIIDLNRRGIAIAEDYATIILKKMLTPFPVGFVDLQSPAGLVSNVAVYNYDGGVFASDESRMLAETGDLKFRLGHVSDPYVDLFYGPKARSFTYSGVNEALAGCSECGLQAYCGADPVRNHADSGDIEGYRPSSSYCRSNMEIIRFLLETLDSDTYAAKLFGQWATR